MSKLPCKERGEGGGARGDRPHRNEGACRLKSHVPAGRRVHYPSHHRPPGHRTYLLISATCRTTGPSGHPLTRVSAAPLAGGVYPAPKKRRRHCPLPEARQAFSRRFPDGARFQGHALSIPPSRPAAGTRSLVCPHAIRTIGDESRSPRRAVDALGSAAERCPLPLLERKDDTPSLSKIPEAAITSRFPGAPPGDR